MASPHCGRSISPTHSSKCGPGPAGYLTSARTNQTVAPMVGSTCAANARLREPNGMPLSGRGGTCATLLFNLATTMVFCRSVNEMIAFYHR